MRLIGECSRCGLCCSGVWAGRPFVCEHLVLTGQIGTPQATRCNAYDRRFNGMAVHWIDQERGTVLAQSVCFKGTEDETRLILPHLGKGCSLEIEGV